MSGMVPSRWLWIYAKTAPGWSEGWIEILQKYYLLVNQHNSGKSPCSMGKSTINGNSRKLFWHNQRLRCRHWESSFFRGPLRVRLETDSFLRSQEWFGHEARRVWMEPKFWPQSSGVNSVTWKNLVMRPWLSLDLGNFREIWNLGLKMDLYLCWWPI